MQKEREPRIGASAAQSLAYLHELVVMDPDQVAGTRRPLYRIRELAIDSFVEIPIPGIEVAARLQIVEQRPNNLVREAFVEVALLLLRQEKWRVFVRMITACLFQ